MVLGTTATKTGGRTLDGFWNLEAAALGLGLGSGGLNSLKGLRLLRVDERASWNIRRIR